VTEIWVFRGHSRSPLTQISRSLYYSTSNNSKTVQDRAIFFHHRIAKPCKFFRIKRHGNIPTGTPHNGASNAGVESTNRDHSDIAGYRSMTCCTCQQQVRRYSDFLVENLNIFIPYLYLASLEPFKSLGAVSCSASILTTDVSLTVYEIFGVKV